MARTALSFKIDQASRDYWKTKDPKFKKEWYRLINIFCILNRRRPSQTKLRS